LGRLADLLDGGQQQADQDGDDGNHHQQFDQREATPPAPCEDSRHGGTSEKERR